MMKNYLVHFVLCTSLILGIASPLELLAQEIKIFSVEDFDLKGPVKFCWVATDYGKEEYTFNKEGILKNACTR